MIDLILNLIKYTVIEKKFKNHNKKTFQNTKNYKNGEILIEFNAFQSFHIPISYFANFLKNNFKSEIKAFYNYSILSSPMKQNLNNKIKWSIGNFFSLKNFGIYKSFGTSKIFRPIINTEHVKKAKNQIIKIRNKIKTKKDVLKIEFDNVVYGDLIYDTYLKSQIKPTLNINDSKFQELLFDFIQLYYFWVDYFENHNVKCIVGVHTSYSYGLPLRIAINKEIPTYVTGLRKVNKLSKKMKFYGGEFKEFPEMFKKIDNKTKEEGIKKAKKKLEDRKKGISGVKVDLISSEISSFHNKFVNRKITNNKKIKILIAPHDFFDAIHAKGDLLFPDFYEWIDFLGKMSEITNYDWYIKNRPNYPGKFQKYQPFTTNVVNDFISKYKKIKLLPNDYSHHQIISEKINFVFTCYGTVGTEYPLFGIPVINASINNPHHRYNFNFNPKTVEELKEIILNLPNLKMTINKEEIYEHYFLKHIYITKNWLVDDLENLINFVDGWSGQNSHKIYEYWINKFNLNKHLKIQSSLKKFMSSNENAMTIEHCEIAI